MGPDVLSLRSVAVVTVGLAAYLAVSFLLTAGLFARLEGARIADMWRRSRAANLVSLVGNVTVALLLALVVSIDPRGIALVAVLAVGVQLGYRSYGRMMAERSRAEGLSDLTSSLAGVATGATQIESWLEGVANFFGASGALFADGDAIMSSHEPPARVLSTVMDVRNLDVGENVRRDILLAAVRNGPHPARLAVWERNGFEAWNEADAHLLAVIASEAAVALENAELFQQVERERARWQEESAKLNDILSAASDGIATFSADGQISSWNPGMAALTGVGPLQAVGREWWTVLRLRNADDEELLPGGEHVIETALAGDRHDDPVAVQVLRRDGQWRWIRATFSPLVSDEGDVDGTVMVARDVTAEYEVEELKADFVATVSHELRTPLTPLKGFLATLRERGDLLSPDQVTMLHQSMESQVVRLERLVNDLLVVADLDRGRVRFGHELVALREAARLAVGEEQDPGVDRVRIVGDEDLAAAADGNAVVRVLRALVSNALKHSDGPVTIELDRDGASAVVRVRDEGPGIPPWEQERIFKRFHRLGDHLHRTQGPGLGLSIAKALVDHIGGTLEVDSDVGSGATFTLRLRSAGPVPLASPDRSAIDAG
ncbi:MAG: PAS domain S-box protein [Actinobacteria bacterium]|nr:PAS domain S-box protein [Actinomycetota bacterium]